MMLDLILSECAEENFMRIMDKSNAGLHSNVRRLSLQYDNGHHWRCGSSHKSITCSISCNLWRLSFLAHASPFRVQLSSGINY
uniref:Uncharacterized protein n=1 Tax=Arundo donax TaxID=35708 RepID=A0A0A9D040_ARUDO